MQDEAEELDVRNVSVPGINISTASYQRLKS